MKSERKEQKLPNRVIPVPSLVNFTMPALSGYRPVLDSDHRALQSLTHQLKETGVIDRDVEEREVQSVEELNEIVAEAVAFAKSEKELNPDYYDASAEAILGEGDLAPQDDWTNPSLEGGDDYDDARYRHQEEYGYLEERRTTPVRLADGTIVLAEIL